MFVHERVFYYDCVKAAGLIPITVFKFFYNLTHFKRD